MTPAVEDLQRRALVMRRVRMAVAALVPIEMLLYVPPPSVASALRPVASSVAVVSALLLVVALSTAVTRRVRDPKALLRWARVELAADLLIVLGLLQVFAFDQFSSIWTTLVIVVLEGAFRESLRGALLTWAVANVLYAGIQVHAAVAYPDTAPLDPGSIIFRALVIGIVAVVAGQLASQLEAAVDRHRRSEIALAEQYADLQLIGRVSRAIAAGPEARAAVCQAVAELSGAEVVVLYEPAGPLLRATAVAGCPLEGLPVLSLQYPASGTAEAFRTGRRLHRRVARLPQSAAADMSTEEATSSTFVPVLRDGRPIGVLVLAFDAEIEALPTRVAAALDVLAEEAAVAIARADAAVLLGEQARLDPLTGLVNRRGWEESMEVEVARADRSGRALSMLMLDLDGLKAFNDHAGHQAGDELLAEVARVWRGRLRTGDVLARYGGDEFVALLPGCPIELALPIAESLLVDLPPGAAASIGVAQWNGSEDADDLVARADAALYEGKRAGGGRVVHAKAPAAVVPLPRGRGHVNRRREA